MFLSLKELEENFDVFFSEEEKLLEKEIVRIYNGERIFDDSDNSVFLCSIAHYYENVEGNIHLAIEWYNKSAVLNNSDAMNNLGLYYELVEENYPLAIEWYHKSAALNNSSAMNNLALYYENVEGNYPLAIEWYHKSIALNDSRAMNNLGLYYELVEGNIPLAIEWLQKAAELGNSGAMYSLGYHYKYTERNIPLAIEWLQKATELGNSNADELLEEINTETSEESDDESEDSPLETYSLLRDKCPIYIRNNPQVKVFINRKLYSEKHGIRGECVVCMTEQRLIPFGCCCDACETCYIKLRGKCHTCKY